MNKMVNFGIDLGTSNSLIAKFNKGSVEIFKNPTGFKETLPSVVGFRNDRILIGDKAREWVEKDSGSVASSFKRKLGTTETINLHSIKESKTPIELSAFILKELKTFVHSGEEVEASVITIPASFDTVQSNATKQAGLDAGFKQVILLQEPIAASLAYANKEKNLDLRNSQWIVYDLGGGTFDVALVKIVEGELSVVDHEGDNFLGGADFDSLLVEKVIVPEILKLGSFKDFLGQLKSGSGKYNRLWYRLLHEAETAKIELSAKTSTEVELDLEDDRGKAISDILTITRSDFEGIIKKSVEGTVEMMRKILTRNSLRPDDIQFVLMVGGSTYIPYVRQRVEEMLGVKVNTAIDPTNAIAVGAAYFAGTREFRTDDELAKSAEIQQIRVRGVYNRNSQEIEELFSAKVEGDTTGLFFRITGEDGAYDSGLKTLTPRISEDLPLREGAYNLFQFIVVDAQGNQLDVQFDSIQIAQGRYSVSGQMLPDDICLVKDDRSGGDTVLQRIFARNSILPAKSPDQTVEAGTTVQKGTDNEIRIMVVEGPASRHHTTNKQIGVLAISGQQLTRDLVKGSEIDLTFHISESRDVTISALIVSTGQEFSQVYNPKEIDIRPDILRQEVIRLEETILKETEEASEKGNNETVQKLDDLMSEVRNLIGVSSDIASDDVTDDRFKLDQRKRQVAQEFFDLTSSKRIEASSESYLELKHELASLIHEHGSDREKQQFKDILASEQTFIHSSNPEKIDAATNNLDTLRFQILMRLPDFLTGMFEHLVENRASMSDQSQAKQLIDHGKSLIKQAEWDDLREVTGSLWNLMPNEDRMSDEYAGFTGIV